MTAINVHAGYIDEEPMRVPLARAMTTTQILEYVFFKYGLAGDWSKYCLVEVDELGVIRQVFRDAEVPMPSQEPRSSEWRLLLRSKALLERLLEREGRSRAARMFPRTLSGCESLVTTLRNRTPVYNLAPSRTPSDEMRESSAVAEIIFLSALNQAIVRDVVGYDLLENINNHVMTSEGAAAAADEYHRGRSSVFRMFDEPVPSPRLGATSGDENDDQSLLVRRKTTNKLSKFFGVRTDELGVETMRQVMYMEALLDSAQNRRVEAVLSPLPIDGNRSREASLRVPPMLIIPKTDGRAGAEGPTTPGSVMAEAADDDATSLQAASNAIVTASSLEDEMDLNFYGTMRRIARQRNQRDRTLKLASFFGVNQSEDDVERLRSSLSSCEDASAPMRGSVDILRSALPEVRTPDTPDSSRESPSTTRKMLKIRNIFRDSGASPLLHTSPSPPGGSSGTASASSDLSTSPTSPVQHVRSMSLPSKLLKSGAAAASQQQQQQEKLEKLEKQHGASKSFGGITMREEIDVDDVATRLRNGIKLSTRRYRLRTFANCFTGEAVVQWLIEHALTIGRLSYDEAVELAKRLVERRVFEHVLGQPGFQWGSFLYRFCDARSSPSSGSKPPVARPAPTPATPSSASEQLVDIPVNVVRKEGVLLLWEFDDDERSGAWRKRYCSIAGKALLLYDVNDAATPESLRAAKPIMSLSLEQRRIDYYPSTRNFAFELQPMSSSSSTTAAATLASSSSSSNVSSAVATAAGEDSGESVILAAESFQARTLWMNALKISARLRSSVDQTVSSDLLRGNGNKARSLEDFEFLKVLGRGTSGKVIQVMEKRTRRVYAMKIVKKESLLGAKHLSGARVENKLLRELAHPFLVELHYAFQSRERLYFVMDYLAGGELFYHVCEAGAFPEPRARFYAAEILLALRYLHARGIIYRDLKLENVLLGADGHVKVTDFGMCKVDLGNGLRTNSMCGTMEYLPPEILLRTSYSFSVDWWTFGLVLYEMLVGEHPFFSEDRQTLYHNILNKEVEYPDAISNTAVSILAQLLERDPEYRLGCVGDDGADIAAHEFFAPIDFNRLERKEIPPPFIPRIDASDDVSYFDEVFTSEPVQLTPPTKPIPSFIDEAFTTFNYVKGSSAS